MPSPFTTKPREKPPEPPREAVRPEFAPEPESFESLSAPESAPAVERPAPVETAAAEVSVPAAPVPAAPPIPKDRLTQEIESVLEEDLTDFFLKMDPAQQQAFKQKGEETASKIRQLLTKARGHSRKIFHLVKSWLKLIPGVNKFFLEQEAKIKTDKILLTAEEEQRRAGDRS